MDDGVVYGRGISFPPRVGSDGRVAWSEGAANVRESIRILLMTEPQERVALPEFGGGLARLLFEPNTTATWQSIRDRIDKALSRWEPRVRVEAIDVDADPADVDAAVATITYRLVATGTRERVSVKVAVAA